nr:MAG TPA: hypothetical protein [Caudoviricetes sp.]
MRTWANLSTHQLFNSSTNFLTPQLFNFST